MKNEIVRIREVASQKERIYDDSRLYFKITFSDSLRWQAIHETLEGLRPHIVKVIDDRTVKITLEKSKYSDFIAAVYSSSKHINDIAETSPKDVIEANLSKPVSTSPDTFVHVTIELWESI